jgi:hypothetical protein
MFKKALITLMCFSMLGLTACGQKEYFEAVKEQNITIQSMNLADRAARAKEEERHEERMLLLMQNSMRAAASTKDKTDDILVPLLIMSMEDKRVMAKALTANSEKPMQFQHIKAPDSFGDGVQKSTAALLGIGGIILGITQSNNLADIATAGLNAAGTHNIVSGEGNTVTNDSYKAGSQNTTTGDNNAITAGSVTANSPTDNCADGSCGEEGGEGGSAGAEGEASTGLLQCIQNPPGGYGANSMPLYSPTCSCKSHFAGKC